MLLKSSLFILLFFPSVAFAVTEDITAEAIDLPQQIEQINNNFRRIEQDKLNKRDRAEIGEIRMFAGSTAPSGWLLCQGQSLSTSTYYRLYSIIGTSYGSGAGTFNLPDFRGVFPKGAGTQDIGGVSYSGTLGDGNADKFQGHFHKGKLYGTEAADNKIDTRNSGANNNGGLVTGNGTDIGVNSLYLTGPYTDGTNGTPRTGTVTEPANAVVNFIIFTGL